MGNLKTAALACGVVVSVLGGGIGVAYITSSTVRSADMLVKEDVVLPIKASTSNLTAATIADDTKATTNNRTTTKKSYTAENTTAASKNYVAAQEGTTSQRATQAATTAAQISRSVPAPAHAPAAITEPVTQAATTAAIVAKTVNDAAKITSLVTKPVTTTTKATTTTTTTTVIEETTTETEPVETPTEAQDLTDAYVEPEAEPIVTDIEPVVEESSLGISDSDYILLCNAVAHEAGSNGISTYDKALVVEVIMNRVNSPRFPNTIYDVLTQRNQFTGAWGYVDLGTYSSFVTQSVKDAVTYYFDNQESFTQGYFSFWGDGYRNHFS